MNGIINLNKPEGMTSHKAVSIARRLLGIKRIGHTGTLDPMVSGVLPLCVGAATRLVEYMDTDYKTYEGEVTLGLKTDTQDVWGTTIEENHEKALGFTEEEIRAAFGQFEGYIMQIPPNYSAIKVAGKKLYEYARKGEYVEVKARQIHIRKLEIHEINLPKITFLVECSKGTYIRTICEDVGNILGCGGAMSKLVRTQSGLFTLEDTLTIEELEKAVVEGTLKMIPMDFPLVLFDGFEMDSFESAMVFVNGGYLETDQVKLIEPMRYDFEAADMLYKAYYNNVFIGVAKYDGQTKKIKAHKVFTRDGFSTLASDNS